MESTDRAVASSGGAAPVPGRAASPWDRDRRWFVLGLVALAEIFVFIDLYDTYFYFQDRADMAYYLDQSQLSHWSIEFWGRFPVFPLVIDVVGTGSALHVLQVVVSAGAACWLAVELMLTVRHRVWGVVVALWWVAIWRTGGVQFFHHIAVSEALSNGMMMAILAATLQLLRRPTTATRVVLGALLVVWALTRPSNFTVLLVAGTVLLALWWFRRDRPEARDLRLFGALALGLGLVVPAVGSGGEPSTFFNIIPEWIVTDPEALAWWEDRGMPVPPELVASAGVALDGNDQLLDGPLAEWKAWVTDEGPATYARWVVTHPGWALDRYRSALGGAFTYVERERNADFDELVEGLGARPAPLREVGDPVYPAAGALLVLWVGAATALVLVAVRDGDRLTAPAWLGVALVLPVPVLLVPVVFGDSQELGRHALALAVQLRLGLLLVTAWGVDRLLARRVTPARVSTPASA